MRWATYVAEAQPLVDWDPYQEEEGHGSPARLPCRQGAMQGQVQPREGPRLHTGRGIQLAPHPGAPPASVTWECAISIMHVRGESWLVGCESD